jgi:hypothetical protein
MQQQSKGRARWVLPQAGQQTAEQDKENRQEGAVPPAFKRKTWETAAPDQAKSNAGQQENRLIESAWSETQCCLRIAHCLIAACLQMGVAVDRYCSPQLLWLCMMWRQLLQQHRQLHTGQHC